MNNKFFTSFLIVLAFTANALPMFASYTDLQIAAIKGNVAKLEEIINNGVDINIQSDNENGWATLHYAAWNGRFDCVKLLVENGANPYANTKKGETAADLAKQHYLSESYTIIRYLNGQPAGEYRKILEEKDIPEIKEPEGAADEEAASASSTPPNQE
ncbi:ankyrin repeat domain-containing protein [bacterium]|nr:MAG: ankyrin repeat domain-containing protein [bacterium]